MLSAIIQSLWKCALSHPFVNAFPFVVATYNSLPFVQCSFCLFIFAVDLLAKYYFPSLLSVSYIF